MTSISSASQQRYAYTDVGKDIDSLIQKVNPDLITGIKITDLFNNRVIYEKDANKNYTPASFTKIITLLPLLMEYFKPNYTFTSSISLGFDDGKLYLNIHDPNFHTKDLKALLDRLEQTGISMDGLDIIKQEFSIPPVMVHKTIEDINRGYGAPINKVHINKNYCPLTVEPSRIGEKIKILTTDELFPYEIDNQAITVLNYEQAKPLKVTIEGNRYIITGKLSLSQGQTKIDAVTQDNYAHIRNVIQRLLPGKYIGFANEMPYQDATESGSKNRILVTNDTNVRDVVGIALKQSDNFIADYIMATYATCEGESTWEGSTKRLRTLIQDKFNVDLTESRMDDGSGLSRRNLFTVNQLDSFLKEVAKKQNFEHTVALMASPQDASSTLSGHKFPKDMKLYAKTGTLSGVSNLLGYVYPKAIATPYSFVISMNNIDGNVEKYRTLQDDIVKLFE